jgi:DNA-binding beta-propeller fold protein YncE
MAATTDGKLVVTDDIGGAVVELTDPAGPECQSHYVAGTHETFLDSDIPFGAFSANEGDVVGKGADAKFAAVDKVTVDLGGNIYVSDFGNHKLKKIGTDGDRTVTTVATLGASDQVFALAWLGGKLYASGTDGSDDFLLRVDPAKATDNVEELFRERGHFPDVDSSTQAVLTSLVTDGEALIVGGKGYIWRMDKDGEVLATLAGAGAALEFPSDFDPKVPHPAGEWPFVMPGSGDTWLMHAGGRIYWAAGIGVARTVVRFNCP